MGPGPRANYKEISLIIIRSCPDPVLIIIGICPDPVLIIIRDLIPGVVICGGVPPPPYKAKVKPRDIILPSQ